MIEKNVLKKAEKDDGQAAYVAGKFFMAEGNYETAFYYIKKAVKRNFAPAFPVIANMYKEGIGTKINARLANKYYRKAAKKKYAEAILRLSESYAYGFGVKRNDKRAYSL